MLTPFGNSLMFFAYSDGTLTGRLWKSDGTAEGTVQVGPDEPHSYGAAAVGDTFYFTAAGNLGHRLYGYRSNGAGVFDVKGFGDGQPLSLTNVNGTLYFSVWQPDTGAELWKSDGTPEGTVQVADVNPGPVGSQPDNLLLLNGHTLFFSALRDDVGRELWKLEVPGVVGRHVFYNGSRADGGDPGADAHDDAAVAPDKQALRPGGDATFANVTSYTRGINGIMVDVAGLPEGVTLTAADFAFVAYTAGGPPGGAPAPAPSGVIVRRGAGASGTDRVTVVWSDAAVRNGWLRVTVKATERTGLASPDVFSFGNLVGDTGGAGALKVDAADVLRTRLNLGRTDATARNIYDFNRDGAINSLDLLVARVAQGRGAALGLPPGAAAPAAPAPTASPLGAPRGPTRPAGRGLFETTADVLGLQA
jgi:ELWxxDGT repeat protein